MPSAVVAAHETIDAAHGASNRTLLDSIGGNGDLRDIYNIVGNCIWPLLSHLSIHSAHPRPNPGCVSAASPYPWAQRGCFTPEHRRQLLQHQITKEWAGWSKLCTYFQLRGRIAGRAGEGNDAQCPRVILRPCFYLDISVDCRRRCNSEAAWSLTSANHSGS